MIEWASKHSDVLQIATAIFTALVWVIYLQLIHSNLRRRRRSQVLINAGGSCSFGASCFIANIGLEPVYVSDVVLAFQIAGERHEALLTDRTEVPWEDLSRPSDATVEGPLGSNEQIAIGTFEQLVSRAALASYDKVASADIRMVDSLEVTAVLTTAAGSGIVGARREFLAKGPRENRVIVPASVGTHQIRSGFERRQLERQMSQRVRCRT